MSAAWASAIKHVELRSLPTQSDARGALTEIMRFAWIENSPTPIQFNYVRSAPNVLRGVHLHVTHWDYVLIPEGSATIGLVDLRQSSPTYRNVQMLQMSGCGMGLLTIPPGVGHGFYFRETGVFLYGVSSYWDPVNDEFACRWNDPALGMNWGIDHAPLLSERDARAGTLDDMLQRVSRRLT